MKRIIRNAIILLMFLFVVLPGLQHKRRKNHLPVRGAAAVPMILEASGRQHPPRKDHQAGAEHETSACSSEEEERNMARGTAFAQKATDSAGYRKPSLNLRRPRTQPPGCLL
jgi:hypothetical protein